MGLIKNAFCITEASPSLLPAACRSDFWTDCPSGTSCVSSQPLPTPPSGLWSPGVSEPLWHGLHHGGSVLMECFFHLSSTVSILSWPLDTMGGTENQSRVPWPWLYCTIPWLTASSQRVREEYHTATHKTSTLDKSLDLSVSQLSPVRTTVLYSPAWGCLNSESVLSSCALLLL